MSYNYTSSFLEDLLQNLDPGITNPESIKTYRTFYPELLTTLRTSCYDLIFEQAELVHPADFVDSWMDKFGAKLVRCFLFLVLLFKPIPQKTTPITFRGYFHA